MWVDPGGRPARRGGPGCRRGERRAGRPASASPRVPSPLLERLNEPPVLLRGNAPVYRGPDLRAVQAEQCRGVQPEAGEDFRPEDPVRVRKQLLEAAFPV